MDQIDKIYAEHKNSKIREYYEQLTSTEKTALKIAHHMLETSFDIEKSIGYLEWIKLSTSSSTLPSS